MCRQNPNWALAARYIYTILTEKSCSNSPLAVVVRPISFV